MFFEDIKYFKSNNIYLEGRNDKYESVNIVYILLKRFTFFKNDKIFSADTSLNKFFKLSAWQRERLSLSKSAQYNRKCFTVKGESHPIQ